MESENNNLLPNRWSQGKLAEIISHTGIVSDGDWIESKDQDPNGTVRLVQLADIGDGKFLSKSSRYMTLEAANRLNCTFLKAGDILIARMPDPLGRACIFPEVEHKSVTVVDVCLIRTNENSALQNDLFKYWINTPQIRSEISLQATGSTRKRITRKKLSAFDFPIPPLPEQKRIVEKLDSLLAQVDSIQQRLNNLTDIIKRFRQSVLAAAVSGKLTEQWRGENIVISPNIDEFITYWTERYESLGLKFAKPKLNSKTEDINSYPETWLNTQLGNIFDVYVGSTPSRKCREYWAGEVPWVSSGEVAFCRINSTKEKITELGLSNASTKLHPIGTVMLAMIGQGKTRGQPAILNIEAAHNQNTAALRIPDSYCVSEYLYFYLSKQYEETRMVGAGNNQKALNKKSVQSLNFACPPKEEQTEIVRLIEQYFALADTLEKNLANAKQRVDNLTQSILAKAFRGELVPQDPNDEPADKLLARIKAARLEAEKLEKAVKKAAKASKK